MNRSELERLRRMLDQGLELSRQTQRALVEFALGSPPQPHRDGCAFLRGEACTCEEAGPMDLSLKAELTGGTP